MTDDEITALIDQENDQYPVHTLCEMLDVPYKSLTKTVSNRDQENQQLTNRILEIHHESKRRYGAPKFNMSKVGTIVKEFTVVLVIKHRNKWRTTMLTQVDSLQMYLLHSFIWRGRHDSLLWRASNVFKLAGFLA